MWFDPRRPREIVALAGKVSCKNPRPVGVRELRRRLLTVLLVGQVAGACPAVRSGGSREADLQLARPDQRPVAEWQLFTPPDGSFSVRMPSEPKVSGTPPEVDYFVTIGRSATYQVHLSPFPNPGGRSLKELVETTPAAMVEVLREYGPRLIWSETGHASGDSCVTFLFETTTARPQTRALYRVIFDVVDLRMVTISYGAPADRFQEPRAKEFIASLALRRGRPR